MRYAPGRRTFPQPTADPGVACGAIDRDVFGWHHPPCDPDCDRRSVRSAGRRPSGRSRSQLRRRRHRYDLCTMLLPRTKVAITIIMALRVLRSQVKLFMRAPRYARPSSCCVKSVSCSARDLPAYPVGYTKPTWDPPASSRTVRLMRPPYPNTTDSTACASATAPARFRRFMCASTISGIFGSRRSPEVARPGSRLTTLCVTPSQRTSV